MSVVLQSSGGGSITLQEPATASNRTLTLPDTTGTVALTSQLGGTTLLGTVASTSGNSVSLSGLDLTSYKQLFIVWNGVTCSNSGSTTLFYSSDNTQSGSYSNSFTTSARYCFDICDLSSGAFWLGSTQAGYSGKSNITTSSTTVYFRLASTHTFTAGSISLYGVK